MTRLRELDPDVRRVRLYHRAAERHARRVDLLRGLRPTPHCSRCVALVYRIHHRMWGSLSGATDYLDGLLRQSNRLCQVLAGCVDVDDRVVNGTAFSRAAAVELRGLPGHRGGRRR